MPPFRLGFVCEMVLGHATYYQQVVQAAESFADLQLVPMQVPYATSRPLHRLPPLSNWTVRAGVLAHQALRRSGPLDALLINTQTAAVGCLGTMRRVPTIISSDATPANYDELSEAYAHRVRSGPLEKGKRQLLTKTYGRAAAVVAWSDWVRSSLMTDYDVPPSRIRVIPAGLTIGEQPPPRSGHGGPMRVLFVGADFERKGGSDLLCAAERLDIELHVVTRTRLAERPGLHVYSDISPGDPRLRELYAKADVFALPTRGDASPWVLLEAMEAGLPIVTCAVGAVGEVVQHGRNGVLVPPADVPALVAALTRLADDEPERVRMGAAGRQLVEQHHDVRRTIGEIFDLARELSGK